MRTSKWSLLLAFIPLFAACSGGPSEQDELDTTQTTDSTQDARLQKTRNIFYNVPSPMETAALLKKAGAQYNASILNDVKNVDKYTSASKQALNLGVYGADLSYASVFNQTQESMFYTSCSKKLADRLGVIHAFNDSTLEAMESSMNDRDALLDIISETYWSMDAYLKENERDNISVLMIAGGWMEGLYIATQVSKTNDAPELRQRIAEQKLSLGDLIGLVGTYEGEDASIGNVKGDLEALAALFADVNVGGGGATLTQENGVAVIGGDAPTAALTDAQLAAITAKAEAIRTNYIN
ncbi:MAG: hypothetical protein WEC15_03560 [Flavobacteriales bacterium]